MAGDVPRLFTCLLCISEVLQERNLPGSICTSISQCSLCFLQINFQTSTVLIFKHEHALGSSRGLAKIEINGPAPRTSAQQVWDWLKECVFRTELPDNISAIDTPTALWESLSYRIFSQKHHVGLSPTHISFMSNWIKRFTSRLSVLLECSGIPPVCEILAVLNVNKNEQNDPYS